MIIRPLPSAVLNLTKEWRSKGNGLFRGHCFIDGHPDESAIFDESIPMDETLALLRSTQGFYSCILWREDRLVLIVDHMRSYPLFYRISGNSITVADEAQSLSDPSQDPLSGTAALEFLCVGYVTGDETLIPGIKQVEPGTCVVFEDGKATRRVHFDYRPNLKQSVGPEDYYGAFMRALEQAFERLRQVVGGRQIALPLSGGLDSRLVALCLKRYDFPNVIVFTYGRPGNREAVVSKRVAAELGFDWHFVPYSNDMWGNVAKSRSWLEYCREAFGFTSVPHLQDFPAVESLKKEGVIEDGAFFTPGHRPDGAYLPRLAWNDDGMLRSAELVGEIMKNHYGLWRYAPGSAIDSVFHSRVSAHLKAGEWVHKTVAACLRENWYQRERSPKFLVNSVRAYESLGFDWWLPLLDKGFLSFWEEQAWECKEIHCYDRSVRALMNELMANPDKIDEGASVQDPVEYHVAPRIRESIDRAGLAKMIPSDLIGKALGSIGFYNEKDYETADHAFFGIVDRKVFLQTWTGNENVNSFLALSILGELIDPAKLSPLERESLKSIEVFKSNMLHYLERNARSVRWRSFLSAGSSKARVSKTAPPSDP